MKFTEDSKRATYVRSVKIEDGPVHDQAYSQTGRRFRVEHIKITYTLTEDGGWEVKNEWAVELSGTVLKKDGSDSLNHHDRHPAVTNWKDKIFTPEYAWVQVVVDSLRPIGTPETPVLLRELEL